jgi:hypothetical protein
VKTCNFTTWTTRTHLYQLRYIDDVLSVYFTLFCGFLVSIYYVVLWFSCQYILRCFVVFLLVYITLFCGFLVSIYYVVLWFSCQYILRCFVVFLLVYFTLFCGFLVSIYPNELDIKHITDILKVPSRYIDLYLKIVDESRIWFKLNDKREYFPI